MELTDIPEDAFTGDETPPDLDTLESPESLFKEGPIRERLLDVVTRLRSPTKVSDIAEFADCDTETARDYLEWFAEMGMVRREDGRPVRYERNDDYYEWRRVERIRDAYSEEEIVEALSETIEAIKEYRAQFDATHPGEVSLVEASRDMTTEAAWEALTTWETLERRAAFLDAARRNDSLVGSTPGPVDA